MTADDRTAVRVIGTAVHISDPDPQERVMIENARSVLDGAADVLGTRCATLREVRFTATELARSLREMLDLVDPDGDAGEAGA